MNEALPDSSQMDGHFNFSLGLLLLFTTCTALTHTLLIQAGFGDNYYASTMGTEVRRFGFAITIACSSFAAFGLLKSPFCPSHWIGLRIFVIFGSMLTIQHFFSGEQPASLFEARNPPPEIYTHLFYIIPVSSVILTSIAVTISKNVLWGTLSFLTMLVELSIALVLMIIARQPEQLWLVYEQLIQYEFAIFAVGIVSNFGILYLSVRQQFGFWGTLASFSFVSVPFSCKVYEWVYT